MNSAELMRWLRRRPFLPFSIHMTDGEQFDVRHPEEVVAQKSIAYVARRGTAGRWSDTTASISLLHVVRIEPLIP